MTAAYILPFALYLLGTLVASRFGTASYPYAYGCVVGIVAGVSIWQLRGKQVIQPHPRVGLGILFGLVGIALWIWLSAIQESFITNLPAWLQPEARVGYNPFEELGNSTAAWTFIAIRTLGIAAIVPIAEELFWRGFLLRWTIDPEWEKVPLGEYTFSSCMMVTVMFTAAHPEWLAAACYCLLINGLMYWKRDLWLCIVAHAVSNFTLVCYILVMQAWWLW
ncbi:MAG: CAAX prenyl protease-related protein [Pirellulaceae bacterium]